MIVTKLKGGLGNQLFQYATARRFAVEKDHKILLLDTSLYAGYGGREYKLDKFNIKGKSYKSRAISALLSKIGSYHKEIKYRYNPKIFEDNKGIVILDGYWQSYKYFQEIKERLIQEISLKGGKHKSMHPFNNSVAIHVRRGDYASNRKTNSYHGLLPIDYYKNALDYIERTGRNISRCYVFSDDITWCEKHINLSKETTFVKGGSDIDDFNAMKMFNWQIIANSTYSWWTAWTNQGKDKIVISPKKWFNNANLDTSKLIPKDWIQI